MTRNDAFSHKILSKIEGDLLDESHYLLWELFKLSVCGKLSHFSSSERSNLIFFYENLHDLLIATAAYAVRLAAHTLKPAEND